jgi:hypothetical protein
VSRGVSLVSVGFTVLGVANTFRQSIELTQLVIFALLCFHGGFLYSSEVLVATTDGVACGIQAETSPGGSCA